MSTELFYGFSGTVSEEKCVQLPPLRDEITHARADSQGSALI
jgi:hypothetical protein